jgi:diguanylate cyclase (GGDEF)-like protein/PAS domain S-box-containing protein
VLNFGSLAALLPDAVLVVDEAGVLHYANPAADHLFGMSTDSRLGQNCFDLIHPGDLKMTLLALVGMNDQEIATPLEMRVQTEEGWRVAETLGATIQHPVMGQGVALSIRDLTDRRKWEIAAGDDAKFRAMLRNGVGLTLLVNGAGNIVSASAAVTRMLGHDLTSIVGQTLIDLLLEADHRTFQTAYQKALREPTTSTDGTKIEVRLNRRSGTAVPYQLTMVNLLEDPTVNGIVVTGHDISELRAAQEELGRLVYLDPLTGLPNRGELVCELESRLRPRRPGDEQELVVVYIDLDRFKPVNDLFGHLAGDELLISVGQRLRRTTRDGELVARLGGGEFVVVADATGSDPLYGLCGRLEAAIAEPFHLEAGTVQLYASVGGVLAYSGDPVDTVLAEADTAMYTRKRRGQAIRPDKGLPVVERRSLAEGLQQAFDKEEFVLFY